MMKGVQVLKITVGTTPHNYGRLLWPDTEPYRHSQLLVLSSVMLLHGKHQYSQCKLLFDYYIQTTVVEYGVLVHWLYPQLLQR